MRISSLIGLSPAHRWAATATVYRVWNNARVGRSSWVIGRVARYGGLVISDTSWPCMHQL